MRGPCVMRYESGFPRAIPQLKVGCIRVTHPCATLKVPEGTSTVRLACIKPAASVHPEPGSNSPLYLLFRPVVKPGLSIPEMIKPSKHHPKLADAAMHPLMLSGSPSRVHY